MILPVRLYLQLTDICNVLCSVCVYRNHRGYAPKGTIMSDVLLRRILTEIENNESITEVHFAPMYGEPQLHPKFIDFVKDIKKIRSSIFISSLTNGKLIDEEFCRLYSGDHVHISVLGNKTVNPSYEDITGLKFVSLKLLSKLCQDYGLSVGYNITASSLDDVIEIMDFLYVDNFKAIYKIFNTTYLDLSKHLDKVLYINAKYKESRLDNAFHILDKYIIENNLQAEVFQNASVTPCPVLYEDMAITCSGDVLLCVCGDISMRHIIGNIGNSSIREIYNTDYVHRIREHLKRGVCPIECMNFCGKKGGGDMYSQVNRL